MKQKPDPNLVMWLNIDTYQDKYLITTLILFIGYEQYILSTAQLPLAL